MRLAPFWRYYGGKNRAASWYPQPEYGSIVEPFAGAAGYSCQYPSANVTLVDKSPIVAGVWRFLIRSSAADILAIPDIPDGGTVDDIIACQEARWLAGFWCNNGAVSPSKTASVFAKAALAAGTLGGWSPKTRERIAGQVGAVSHWRVIEGDYRDAPDVEATWHIDSPYNNKAGGYYPHQPDSFSSLGDWCRSRSGLVMVCENAGADWLPFKPLRRIKSMEGRRGKGVSSEVIWLNRRPASSWGVQSSMFGRP